jgi:hypothetical protein
MPYLPRKPFVMAVLAALTVIPTVRGNTPYEYHSVVPAYLQFLKDDVSLPGVSSVKRFRSAVIEPHQDVFRSVASGWLNDRSLERLVRSLKSQTEQLQQVDAEFPGRFDKAYGRFAEHAGDLKPGGLVYLLPAPRSAVGGSVRPLGEKDAVIFGTEEIALALRTKTGIDVLVQHELTHLYHQQVNPEMRQMVAEVYMPPFNEGRAKVYQVMWLEGLAVYTSQLLNPAAPEKEVLVSTSLATNVKAHWPQLGAELRKHLDSTKKADIDAFHFAPDFKRHIPARTGYYVGMLVARQMAKKYTFQQLARLAGPQLRSEIGQALLELEKHDIER